MFHPERWAQAFVNTCGEDAETGLAAFKALLPCLRRLPAPVRGEYAARQLEGMIRYALAEAGPGNGAKPVAGLKGGLETAVRFILLLVKKGCFQYGATVAAEVENLLDRKKGILKVTVEAVSPPDPAFERELEAALLKKAAAAGVRAGVRIRPELLGGFRLIIGSEMWDASLRGRIQNMARTLKAAPGVSDGGFA